MYCLTTEQEGFDKQYGMALPDRVRNLETASAKQTEAIDRLTEALQSQSLATPPQPTETTRPKLGFWGWAPRISWIVSPIALIVAVIALTLPRYSAHAEKDLNNTIDGRIETKLQDPNQQVINLRIDVGKLTTQVEGFGKRLDDYILLVKLAAARKLKDAMSLPAKNFAADLPEIKAAIDIAKSTQIPSSPYGPELQTRLRATASDSPAYWQTVGALVSYRSADGSVVSQFLPPCEHLIVDMVPGKTTVTNPKNGKSTPVTGPMIHNGCTLQLDGIRLVGHHFKNSVVIYRGGPVDLKDVQFEDCLWDINIPAQEKPTAEGQKLLAKLLDSETQNVSVSTSP